MATVTLAPAAQAIIGTPVTSIAAAGFAVTHAITCEVQNQEETIDVTLSGTTSAGGALDFATIAKVVPQREGLYNFIVNDGTTTVIATLKVSAS